MTLIREFERVVQDLYDTDVIQSPVHLSIGQELLSVLIADVVQQGDKIVGNYRSHALAIALSDELEPLILELLAKKGGVSGGKAGSMHLSVPNKGMYWTSAIVGTGVPVACGIADALKRDGDQRVALVMFGDGAIEEGCVLESINIAATFGLPLIFVLEDNGLAINTPKEIRSGLKSYTDLARSFGIESWDLTYKDPVLLDSSLSKAVAYVRDNCRPAFIRVECYRWTEHVGTHTDWHLGYRSESDAIPWYTCDILNQCEKFGISKAEQILYAKKTYDRIKSIFTICSNSPDPDINDLSKEVV
ncbi:thiamine pyrophosphate-dependent enzyme [Cyanobium sp. Alchichica 3B3-8F6]|uniref:thiamine pyrophosphate-dependent enzyme n=1 Tax=Cyanobium sp. Alchichica 3B3-8F6 TaxID=2823696 RepID=UPI0020CF921A|nr:thiamine pyrophosphate-dependent enzyme [Cyanobium sp. Alchichica 3B3-8F6]